ncbi:MAG: FAD binding domain-containing protein [Nocardioidaceae bacterium]
MVTDFAIEEPRSLDAAVDLLRDADDSVRPIAGGTGLTLLMRYGFFEPSRLVSLRRLPEELARIQPEPDGSLTIGALATATDLERSAAIAEHAPMMRDALHRLSSVRVRNVATVGGCLAHGHPQMDLPPVLIALDAQVRVRSAAGERTIAAEDLVQGYYETALEPGELITEVRVPPHPDGHGRYHKVTARTFEDWPTLGLAVRCDLADGRMRDVRVVVGAVSDRAQRVRAAEELLEDERPTEAVFEHAAGQAAERVDCHSDPTASEEYRRALVRVHLLRTLRDVTDPGGRPAGRDEA